ALQGVEQLLAACARNDVSALRTIAAREPELVRRVVAEGGRVLADFACVGNADGVRHMLDLGVPVTALYPGDGYFDIARDSTAHRRPSPSRRVPAVGATGSLVPEGDTPAGEVVGRDGERHPVAREHADAEATHLPRDRGEHVMTVRQMHTKRGIGQHVLHDTVDFYRFFLRHRVPPSRAGATTQRAGPAHWPSPALHAAER